MEQGLSNISSHGPHLKKKMPLCWSITEIVSTEMILLMHKYKTFKTKYTYIILIWSHVALLNHWSTLSVPVEQQSSGRLLGLRVLGALAFTHTSRLHKKLLGTSRFGLQVQDSQAST